MHRVAIARVENDQVQEAVRQAVELVGGMRAFVSRGSQVLIKPNLVFDLPWESGATTNPRVVAAIVNLVREAGAGRVIVGDRASVGVDTERVFRVTGYDRLANEMSFELADLNRTESTVTKVPRGVALKSVPVARLALESDVVINVPMLKTHLQTKASISLKNMKGVLPYEGKRKDHFVGLEQAIADMNTILKQSLVVIDGTRGQEGMGPISGTPVDMNLIVAADNPVAADSVGVQIMGFEPAEIDHLMLAEALGLGSTTDIEVVGEQVASVRRPFQRCPTEITGFYPGIEVHERTACSGCTGSIVVALERMRQAGELDEISRRYGSLALVVGRDAAPDGADREGRWILVGRCQRKHRGSGHYVPGCPPQGFIIRDVLRMQIDLPPLFATPDWFRQEETVMAESADD